MTEDSTRPDADTYERRGAPFRILVVGDLSGRGNRGPEAGGPEPLARRPVRVDRDSFDKVLAGFGAALRLPAGPGNGDTFVLRFASLDDFRPEALLARVPALRELRATRDRLLCPATFEAAAAEVRAWGAPLAEAKAPPPVPSAPAGVGADLVEEMLRETARRASSEDAAIERLVHEVAAPGVAKLRVAPTPAERPELLARVDTEIGARVRALLHDPDFQALEAAWRGVHLLVRRLETSPALQLHLLDLSREELADDVGVSGGFERSGLHRVVVEQTVGTPGAPPWTLLVGLYAFDAVPDDVATLLRVAKVADTAGAVFLAAADGRVAGCRSLGETPDPDDWTFEGDKLGREIWASLRRVAEVERVGLLWPRILLRAPYGKATGEVEGFAFEEFEGAHAHERLLWGNPALAAALVLGRGFAEAGWDLREALDPEVDDLPAWVFTREGEQVLQPCAEAILTTRGVEAATRHGVMPLLSVQGRACVRLSGLTSLAEGGRLAARW